LINGEGYAGKADFIAAVTASDYDLLIMDLFHNGEVWTPAEIVKLRQKAGGGQRLLICYMSIGEAEDYRYYWNPSWFRSRPGWLAEENPYWDGNYKVKYWYEQWKKIIYGNNGSYLTKIIQAGFDGVYLDIIDAFEYFE
jgi:cysteinyl-tRNA synthetase